MVKTITPEEGAELRQLYADLPKAYLRAAEVLMTNGQPLEGEALQRLLVEDGKASAIVQRIKANSRDSRTTLDGLTIPPCRHDP